MAGSFSLDKTNEHTVQLLPSFGSPLVSLCPPQSCVAENLCPSWIRHLAETCKTKSIEEGSSRPPNSYQLPLFSLGVCCFTFILNLHPWGLSIKGVGSPHTWPQILLCVDCIICVLNKIFGLIQLKMNSATKLTMNLLPNICFAVGWHQQHWRNKE